VLVHAGSGDDAFAACLRLFRNHPLAVRRHYAEPRYGSMVLMSRDTGTTRFFVLIMEWDDLFVLRHWDRRDGTPAEIGPSGPVSGEVRRVIENAVPVPRDGALLGWVSGHQVQVLLAASGRLPEPWDDASVVPRVLVMPLVGSRPAEWPPLAVTPLDDGRLWEYVARGQLTDLGPLVTQRAGCVFRVPAGGEAAGWWHGARIVVTERLSADSCWLPAGVYADQWTPRDGTPPLTASQLLALPGVVDLADGRGQQVLGV
jgi:hypothetical protein